VNDIPTRWDGAPTLAPSYIGLFKTELIRCQGPWRSRDAVEMATPL
jgi:hypothetical protein